MRAVGLVIALLSLCARPAVAADWPQWRGGNRDGVTTEPLPDALPDAGLKRLWRADIPEAFSSMSIAGRRLYTMGRDGDSEIVYCLNARTGKQVWKQSYAAPWKAPAIALNNSPRSTPTVAGGRVFTFGSSGVLSCFAAADGKLLWRHDARREYRASVPAYGHSSSPVVDGDAVTCMVGAPGACVMAFDAKTGKVRWRSLDDNAGYGSPVAAKLGGVRQVMVMTKRGMVSLEAKTGRLLWRHNMRTPYDQNIITAAVSGDRVLVSGYKRGTAALRVTKRAGSVSATTLWTTREASAYMSSPVLYKDRFFVHQRRGGLKCVRLSDGGVIWTRRGFGEHASLIRSGGRLLVLSEGGELILIDADAKTYRELGRTKLVARTWVHHAVADGRLYARDRRGVHCFEMPK